MKKVILTIVAFLVLIHLTPQTALADGQCTDPNYPGDYCQNSPPPDSDCVAHGSCTNGADHICCYPDFGHFHCIWETVIGCVVNNNTKTCSPGYDDLDSVCESINDPSDCNGTIRQACVLVTATNYGCWQGDCIAMDDGPYTDPSCQGVCSAPPGQRYTCHPIQGCLQDDQGEYDSAIQCEWGNGLPACRPPTPTPLPPPQCIDYPPECITDCVENCTRDAYNCCLEIEPFRPGFCDLRVRNPCLPGGVEWISGLETGIGCIPTDPAYFVEIIRDILIKLGAGIAFLMMIIGAFFILTSQGQPERVKRGREIFVGGIIGLILLIFSVFLLRLILVDILGLFGEGLGC